VGYFPADNPQYSCIVVVRTKPHAYIHYGGQLAAPVFREIATKLYAMYIENKQTNSFALSADSSAFYYAGRANEIKNILQTLKVKYVDSSRQNEWINVYAVNYQPVIKEKNIDSKRMPDVRGMGLKDALNLLENRGVKVLVKGKGKVINQSIPAGTAIQKGFKVLIELG